MPKPTALVRSSAWLAALALIPTAATQDRTTDELTRDATKSFSESDWPAAERAYAALVKRNNRDGLAWYRLGYARHAQGKLDAALEAHVRAAEFPGVGKSAAYNAACVHALREQRDEAVSWLRRAAQSGFLDADHASRDPDLESIRGTPEFAAVIAKMEQRRDTPLPEAVVGRPAPDFELGDADGERHRLSSYRGKTVVLEWTSYQCPTVNQYYQQQTLPRTVASVADDDLVWLAVDSGSSCDEWVDEIQRWRRRVEHQRPYLLDPTGTLGHRYGATTTPQVFVIDAAGTLRYAGAVDDENGSVNYVIDTIAALRAGEEVTQTAVEPRGCTVKFRSPDESESVWRCPPCGQPCDSVAFLTAGRCSGCRMVLVERARPKPAAAPRGTAGHADHLWTAARAVARSGEPDACLETLRLAFASGFAQPSRVLADSAFSSLVARPTFRTSLRKLLSEHARESTATIVTDDEPGSRLTLECTVTNAAGEPLEGALVELYQTDSSGIYDPTFGPDNPRLFGYLTTDAAGRCRVHTIVPAGYPGRDVAPHVHYSIEAPDHARTSGEIVLQHDGEKTPSTHAGVPTVIVELRAAEAGKYTATARLVLRE